MIDDIFKHIADKEQGEFLVYKDVVAIENAASGPYEVFQITFQYKDSEIIIDNRVGTTAYGIITCNLSSHISPVAFEIDTISHFKNLFFRKKSRFKVSSENENFKYFLKNKALDPLNTIAKKLDFSPYIYSEKVDGIHKIVMEYHLQFPDWPNALEPIIEFYKNCIDELEKRNMFIAPNYYKNSSQG